MDFITALNATVVNNHIGDYSSIVGVFVSLIGVVIVIATYMKSKSAAEKAKEAVDKITSEYSRFDAVTELAHAISLINEIKTLHTKELYDILPSKYSLLREKIIALRKSYSLFTEEDTQLLQNLITHTRNNEILIVKNMNIDTSQIDNIKMYTVMSKNLDKLQEMHVSIRNKTGR